MVLLTSRDGAFLALYVPGTYETVLPGGTSLSLSVDTAYPADGNIRIQVYPNQEEEFTLSLRIPLWCPGASLSVSGETTPVSPGNTDIRRIWKPGDEIFLNLDMPLTVHRPIPYGRDLLMNKYFFHIHVMAPNLDVEDPEARVHAAFTKGPLVLAADEALGTDLSLVPIVLDESKLIPAPAEVPFECQTALSLPLTNGERVTLVDYASAGKTWKTRIAAWIKCE